MNLTLWASERTRLERLPRRVSGIARIGELDVRFVDAASLLSAYDAIFTARIYDFEARQRPPVIHDCGANIGLATLAVKLRYRQARVVAYEPDPTVFATLAANVAAWGLTRVQLVQAAVWTHGTSLPFTPDGADGGRLGTNGGDSPITVTAVRLRDRLRGPIDLLKLDIESAEVDVLLDIESELDHVDRVFVEYHSLVGRPQRLDELLAV